MNTIEHTHGGPRLPEPATLKPSEKEREIERILDVGLVKRSSVKSCLSGLYHALGLRYLLWDASDALLLSAVTAAILLLIQPLASEDYKHAALFCGSPLLFVIALFFTETLERVDGLYELKMSCRYTIRQVVAFRMLLFCAIGMVFSVLITVRRSSSMSEFWKLLPLAFTAFFLCAFLCLFVVCRIRKKWAHGAAGLLWIAASALPAAFFPKEWELFLKGLPAAVTAAVMLVAGALCFMEGKKFMRQAMEDAYAVC